MTTPRSSADSALRAFRARGIRLRSFQIADHTDTNTVFRGLTYRFDLLLGVGLRDVAEGAG